MSDWSNSTPGNGAAAPIGAYSRREMTSGLSIDTKDVAINAWRGIAALLVAYFHCRQVTWVGMQQFHQLHKSVGGLDLNAVLSYLTLPIAWGSAGVPVFFVISGYCIHRGTAKKLLASPDAVFDTRSFLLRRFARIYPVLLGALLLTLALDTASLHFTPVIHKMNPMDTRAFLVNLFSLQGIAGKTFGSNGALWTLSIEVQFYLVYPFLLAMRRRLGMKALLAGIAVINVISALVFERHEVVLFASYWFSWTLGAWIAEGKVSGVVLGKRAGMGFLAAAIVLAVLGCMAFKYSQYIAFQFWALAFAAYLHQVLDKPMRPTLAVRGFSWLGEFSFSLYVVHLPIFILLSSVFFHEALQMAIWPSVVFMVVPIVVAYGFYLAVERPAMAWGKGFRSH